MFDLHKCQNSTGVIHADILTLTLDNHFLCVLAHEILGQTGDLHPVRFGLDVPGLKSGLRVEASVERRVLISISQDFLTPSKIYSAN